MPEVREIDRQLRSTVSEIIAASLRDGVNPAPPSA